MIRKATLADRPRITEVRHAVRENRLSQASVAKVDTTADWIFANAAFWVWEEDAAVQGFAVADPRDGTIFGLFIHPPRAAAAGLRRSARRGFRRGDPDDGARHAGRTLLPDERVGGDRPAGKWRDHFPQGPLSH